MPSNVPPLADLTNGALEDLVRRNDPYRGKAVYELIDRLTLKADGDAIGHLAAISRLPSARSDRLFHGPSLAWAAIIGLLSAETEQSRAEAYAAFHDLAEDDQRRLLEYLHCRRIEDAHPETS